MDYASKETVLVLSDLHKGSAFSKFKGDLKIAIEKKISEADHIVFNGDVFELFDIGTLKNPKEKMKEKADEAIEYLQSLLKKYPNKKFHFVLGNHENLQYFTKKLDEITHKNFEWSPEAIRIGEAFFTHGDLQMWNQIHGDEASKEVRGTYRLRDMENKPKLSKEYHIEDKPNHLERTVNYWHFPRAIATAALTATGLDGIVISITQSLANTFYTSKKDAIERMHSYLHEHHMKDDFKVVENGEEKPLNLHGIKHVFFGHTHLPFCNEKLGKITYHNSGSLVKGHKIKEPKDIQALTFELSPDGRVENVRRAFKNERGANR